MDEIQNLERHGAEVLRALHQGAPGLPIIPVLAGLAHSQDVLGQCGISRLSRGAVQTLGALNAGEPSETVRQMLDRFDIDATAAAADRWAELIEGWSDCWPQHLQNGMAALAEGLIEAQGVLARVDGNAVAARERQRRISACEARQSLEMLDARLLVAAVMAEIDAGGRQRGEVIGLVEKLERPDESPEWRLPENMSAKDFMHHVIAREALQFNEGHRLACPIPGFHRFLIDCGRQALQQVPSPETPPHP